jgi:hypothetical protein
MQQEESKAQQRTEKYTLDTARKAALYVQQRKSRPAQLGQFTSR